MKKSIGTNENGKEWILKIANFSQAMKCCRCELNFDNENRFLCSYTYTDCGKILRFSSPALIMSDDNGRSPRICGIFLSCENREEPNENNELREEKLLDRVRN